jgi:hypothetical protein
MKYTLLLAIICLPMLAMENELSRVDKNFFSKISEFMQIIFFRQSKTMHEIKAHPDSLHRIREKLCGMSYQEKCSTLKNMSLPLLRLTCAVLYLPTEIIKKHILSVLFKNHTPAIEQFYIDPVGQALTLYHTIEKKCDGKPIGPLYVAKQSERDVLLKVLQSKSQNNAAYKITTDIEELLKQEVSDNLKKLYLKDKTVNISETFIYKIISWILFSAFISVYTQVAMGPEGLQNETLISFACRPSNIIHGLIWLLTGITWLSIPPKEVTY